MKSILQKIAACALALAFLGSLNASTLYFNFTQGTGIQQQFAYGSDAIDNPAYLGSANNVTAPAISVSMMFFNPFGAMMFECTADTNVTAGNYPVGDFYSVGGGSDAVAGIF